MDRLIKKVESYEFECEAGPLENCTDWIELKEDIRDLLRQAQHYHVAGTTIGKHIDTCAKCGHDIRHVIHTSMSR